MWRREGLSDTPRPRADTPLQRYGELFVDVQMLPLFADSKTFADATPRRMAAPALCALYARTKTQPGFSLAEFVQMHFDVDAPAALETEAINSPRLPLREHIRSLWPQWVRHANDNHHDGGSLLPLPHAYVVPGGRFREMYGRDSYFTMLGLVQSGKTALVASMLDNFAYLVRTVGHIPNGNRSYYLSRSQPPYFSAMVGLYAQATDSSKAAAYLDAMEAEHAFWMSGADTLARGRAHRRVVRMTNGAVLNRYWDDRPEPRPESFREDVTLAQSLPDAEREALYRNVRAAAESGWDFSSRWMRDPSSLQSLETTALIPVDLNSLLYHTERTIAALRRVRDANGDNEVATHFDSLAAARRTALLAFSYDTGTGFFYDVRWRTGERVIDRPTMAAAAPLYFGLATSEQAARVVSRLQKDFLKPGGFTTTLVRSGQQWDAPNGWPPLQWLAIQGARRYGHRALADSARARWLSINRKVYDATGKMTEKYDVWDLNRKAGGGEYPTQDGFGWTNGVALRLSRGW